MLQKEGAVLVSEKTSVEFYCQLRTYFDRSGNAIDLQNANPAQYGRKKAY